MLVSNNAAAAHAEGFTGKGVVVGIVELSFDHGKIDSSPLAGKILSFDSALTDFGSGNQDAHFWMTATNLAGEPIGEFHGGIAPDIRLRWGGTCGRSACQYDSTKKRSSLNGLVETLLNYGDVRLVNMS